jgi:hypothetical protein
MRSALVILVGALGLVVLAGTGTRADDKADLGKEFKKFQGVSPSRWAVTRCRPTS